MHGFLGKLGGPGLVMFEALPHTIKSEEAKVIGKVSVFIRDLAANIILEFHARAAGARGHVQGQRYLGKLQLL